MKHKVVIIGWILFILLWTNLSVSARISEEEALQKKAGEIYELIMCPLCAGQTIGQSKNETSRQMRELVQKKLRQGETKEQILQYFESRYGERILATPSKKGFNLILWLLPLVSVVLAGIVIYFLIRRWSARRPAASDVEVHQPSEYEKRLEKELKQFGEHL